MNPAEYVDITDVALYLRKSRGDAETDLEKHRNELVTLCTKYGWAYTEYPEVGTGDSIAIRPKMKELLIDVEQRMFDAVLVVDYDRLGRGDKVDQATIEKTFMNSETYIVTPDKLYDLNNDSDMMLADFKGMIARQEYKAISKRMRRGKATGAKMGNWTNGSPPFPYKYNALTKKIEPDPAVLDTYELMIEKALSGFTATDIAWELNSMGVPSPRNQLWQPAVVRRILLDEVHLGKMVVGKKRKLITSGAIVRKPKDEWLVYHNCHPAVKTELQHQKLMFLYTRAKDTPKASQAGRNAFSGIIKCAKCGSTMQIQKRSARGYDNLKSCKYRDLHGVRCECIGGQMDVVQDAVHKAIRKKAKQLEAAILKGVTLEDHRALIAMSEAKLKAIKKIETRLSNLTDMRADKEISKDEFIEKKAEFERQLHDLETEYAVIQKQADLTMQAKNEDMLSSVQDVIQKIESLKDDKDLNRAYKSIISYVLWDREQIDEDPIISVNFH